MDNNCLFIHYCYWLHRGSLVIKLVDVRGSLTAFLISSPIVIGFVLIVSNVMIQSDQLPKLTSFAIAMSRANM